MRVCSLPIPPLSFVAYLSAQFVAYEEAIFDFDNADHILHSVIVGHGGLFFHCAAVGLLGFGGPSPIHKVVALALLRVLGGA